MIGSDPSLVPLLIRRKDEVTKIYAKQPNRGCSLGRHPASTSTPDGATKKRALFEIRMLWVVCLWFDVHHRLIKAGGRVLRSQGLHHVNVRAGVMSI